MQHRRVQGRPVHLASSGDYISMGQDEVYHHVTDAVPNNAVTIAVTNKETTIGLSGGIATTDGTSHELRGNRISVSVGQTSTDISKYGCFYDRVVNSGRVGGRLPRDRSTKARARAPSHDIVARPGAGAFTEGCEAQNEDSQKLRSSRHVDR